jgi:hypothetical protein
MKKRLKHHIQRVHQRIKEEISSHPLILYVYAECLYRFGLISDSEHIFNRCIWAYGQRDDLKQVRLTWRVMKQRFNYTVI